MFRHTSLLAAAALLALPSALQAQSSSLFGNRGVNASSGTLNNGVGAGGNAGGGNQAVGSAGSMTGFTGATAGSQQGFLSGAAASQGLAGTGNNGNFIGNRNSAAAGQGAGGQYGGARGGLAGGRNSLGSSLSRNNNNRNSNQQRGAANGAQSTPIRPVQVIAFAPPVKSSETIEASLSADIASAASQGRIPNIAVNVDSQGTATLRGHVATESERKKAERLVQIEPGVRKIVNQITVAEQP